jgi:hypothetical protein
MHGAKNSSIITERSPPADKNDYPLPLGAIPGWPILAGLLKVCASTFLPYMIQETEYKFSLVEWNAKLHTNGGEGGFNDLPCCFSQEEGACLHLSKPRTFG